MWVDAYRTNLLEIVVNTTNGVERMNRGFKDYLKAFPDRSLSGMATVLIEKYGPATFEKYMQENIRPLHKYRRYDEDTLLPVWCWNRPRKFQRHIYDNYIKQMIFLGIDLFCVLTV